ncbi:hypothetical protein Gotur_002198 [Gossypium turneri]
MEDMPPGFRFYPTEEELVSFYLHKKLEAKTDDDLNHVMNRVIPVVDIYNFNPWDLPRLRILNKLGIAFDRSLLPWLLKSKLMTRLKLNTPRILRKLRYHLQFSDNLCHKDPEQWFFFIPRQESEARGGRPKRLTSSGYWKATGSPGYVYSFNSRPIGVKRTMVFYNGRAPNGKKTDWKMNEYKAIQDHVSLANATTPPTLRQEFSLCRVYKKSKCLRSFDRRPPGILKIGEPFPGLDNNHINRFTQIGMNENSSTKKDVVDDDEYAFWDVDGFWNL